MMLGIYDLMIYDFMIYDLWVKVQEEWLMMVWGDPLGAFWIQHQRILRAGHKRYQEGETPTNCKGRSIKPHPKPQTEGLEELSPYIYRSFYGLENLSGWSRSRGKRRKNR